MNCKWAFRQNAETLPWMRSQRLGQLSHTPHNIWALSIGNQWGEGHLATWGTVLSVCWSTHQYITTLGCGGDAVDGQSLNVEAVNRNWTQSCCLGSGLMPVLFLDGPALPIQEKVCDLEVLLVSQLLFEQQVEAVASGLCILIVAGGHWNSNSSSHYHTDKLHGTAFKD